MPSTIVEVPTLRRRGDRFTVPARAENTRILTAGWVARLGHWIMRKGCYELHCDEICYRDDTYVRLDTEYLLEALWEWELNLDDIWSYRCNTILVGHDAYRKILGQIDPMPCSFHVETRIGFQDQLQWRGLKIKLVPWMKGVLLI